MKKADLSRTESLPLSVKLLTELISPEERTVAENVKKTHQVHYCPIGISLPKESDVALRYHCGDEKFSEFRYTPLAYFAVRVWETARDNLLKRPEFAGALDIEWYPVTATFRSVRFVNGGTERFTDAMFEEMKRIADSHTIDIRYGRFDAPAVPALPEYPRRYYIMPEKLLIDKGAYAMRDELEPLQDTSAGTFSWNDIEAAFVSLKPIQLAYIAGDEMNNHTPLDEEFFRACRDFDIAKVRELVARGANIHAAAEYGDTAMEIMMMAYFDLADVDEKEHCTFHDEDRKKFIELAQYLLSLGYNINISGYCGSTCLDDATLVDDLEIVKFLLDSGADPNIGSFIGDAGNIWGTTVLARAWDMGAFGDWVFTDLSNLLLRYGALPVTGEERPGEDELNTWIEKLKDEDRWDSTRCAGLSELDSMLVNCARNVFFYYMALIARHGGNIGVRDPLGRNLLQIMLEDAENTKFAPETFQEILAEMALMLLCGLKLKLSDAEIERAKETCRVRGYTEALDVITSVANRTEDP